MIQTQLKARLEISSSKNGKWLRLQSFAAEKAPPSWRIVKVPFKKRNLFKVDHMSCTQVQGESRTVKARSEPAFDCWIYQACQTHLHSEEVFHDVSKELLSSDWSALLNNVHKGHFPRAKLLLVLLGTLTEIFCLFKTKNLKNIQLWNFHASLLVDRCQF